MHKLDTEDMPILTIDGIVICQTHAEDLRRIALKMHPGAEVMTSQSCLFMHGFCREFYFMRP